MKDIRWHQRLNNFRSALIQLLSAIKLAQQRNLSNLEKQGLIQTFKFTHELAWNERLLFMARAPKVLIR